MRIKSSLHIHTCVDVSICLCTYIYIYIYIYIYMSVRQYSLYNPVRWTIGGVLSFAGFGAAEKKGIAFGGSATI